MKRYWPLLILILVSAGAAFALTEQSYGEGAHIWMHNFMGFFLCVFALLKLFDPKGFANGFAMYDLLGKRSKIYRYVYPWLELILGLGYFSFIAPTTVYVATILLFGFGTVGVVKALRAGLDINCPCMGNILKVPLSTVTLSEDIVMVAMAAFMLFV